jgi:hypothetical protein
MRKAVDRGILQAHGFALTFMSPAARSCGCK